MRYLSLFSGAGGGDLAAQHLKGWECVGYVEFNDYCQRVIAARINDGMLDRAPIYGDIRHFIQSGAAREYRGFADVVTGGFPCQPFSNGGNMLGADDERNMWPATIDVVRLVQPKSVFFENVSGLISSGYIVTVCNDLREAGYQVLPPLRLSASDLGANHERERVWIAAHAGGQRVQGGGKQALRRECSLQRLEDGRGVTIPGIRPHLPSSGLCRGRNDVANQVERLRALGNGQVPAVAATAWKLLTEAGG